VIYAHSLKSGDGWLVMAPWTGVTEELVQRWAEENPSIVYFFV
jgi:hypothetical protein